ncbi:MAG: hypothetical protein H6766_05830 [Candidatus Peribacteria bacterium]|nr:MAG: hypothetical protein H6766_05830 [Candidatus Peribacteria bacterium]
MTLNYDNLDGEPLTLEGQVYGGLDDSDPIAGAKIEVRQADDSGKYHPQGNGDYSDYDPTQISLRGYILTDENGAYKISSIYPGLYEGRARHLHLRISADGYNPVITQLILPYEGDTPTPENDNVAQ